MKLKAFSNMISRLRMVEQKLSKKFEESTGISLTRYEILTFLRDNGRSLQSQIASHLEMDPSAITRHMKILEQKGYIQRKRNKENAREIFVNLTDFAKEELLKCKKNQEKNECSLPVALTQEEIESFMDALEKIEDKIN